MVLKLTLCVSVQPGTKVASTSTKAAGAPSGEVQKDHQCQPTWSLPSIMSYLQMQSTATPGETPKRQMSCLCPQRTDRPDLPLPAPRGSTTLSIRPPPHRAVSPCPSDPASRLVSSSPQPCPAQPWAPLNSPFLGVHTVPWHEHAMVALPQTTSSASEYFVSQRLFLSSHGVIALGTKNRGSIWRGRDL